MFKSFGTPQDITDISLAIAPDFVSVSLCNNFPLVRVSSYCKMQLDAEIARKTKTPSAIFRNLIRNLIKEDWRNYNYKKIMERFADKVLASYEYVQNGTKNFTQSECRTAIRQICSEERRKHKTAKQQRESQEEEDNLMSTTTTLTTIVRSESTTEISRMNKKKKYTLIDSDDD